MRIGTCSSAGRVTLTMFLFLATTAAAAAAAASGVMPPSAP